MAGVYLGACQGPQEYFRDGGLSTGGTGNTIGVAGTGGGTGNTIGTAAHQNLPAPLYLAAPVRLPQLVERSIRTAMTGYAAICMASSCG